MLRTGLGRYDKGGFGDLGASGLQQISYSSDSLILNKIERASF